MTKDEEKAEEFANEKCKDCYMCSYSEHKNPYKICQRRKDRKQAFLAGLKADRPKWHKVADGDLPKENNLYLVAIKDNGLAIAYFNGLHWETKFNLGDFGHCLETVIAWCEIPKFSE
jgi:hypothetical protein